MKNLGNMMKQAQAMQAKMAEMQAKLEQMTVEGAAGGEDGVRDEQPAHHRLLNDEKRREHIPEREAKGSAKKGGGGGTRALSWREPHARELRRRSLSEGGGGTARHACGLQHRARGATTAEGGWQKCRHKAQQHRGG